MQYHSGMSRSVFLVGRYAIKVPILRIPWMWQGRVQGLLANIVENNLWHGYQMQSPVEERPMPGGVVLVGWVHFGDASCEAYR